MFERAKTVLTMPAMVRLRSWASHAFVIAVLLYLAWQLQQIGWSDIWSARPASPLFYILVLVGYFILPVGDALIYRRLWGASLKSSLPVLLRKRLLNAAFIGYSGELLLMLWARRNVALDERQLAHNIKDTNILSAAASGVICAAMLLFLLLQGGMAAFSGSTALYASGFLLTLPAFVSLILARWGKVMRLDGPTAVAIFIIHSLRLLAGQVVLILQWWLVFPAASFNTLTLLLALQMVIGRLPLLPNRDLLFVGMGISVSHSLALPEASFASVLVTSSALQQIFHLLIYLLTFSKPASRLAAA